MNIEKQLETAIKTNHLVLWCSMPIGPLIMSG